MPRKKQNKLKINYLKISNWILNFFGILTLAFLIAFIFGNGIPDFFNLSLKENLLFLCFFIIIGGIITAFRNKLVGGILVLAGSFAFWLINFIFTRNAWLGFYFWFFPLLGIAHLFIWFKKK